MVSFLVREWCSRPVWWSLSVVKSRFIYLINDIAAKAVDAAVEPEAQDLFDLFDNLLVMEVQIDLFIAVEMEIPETDLSIKFPSWLGKHRLPVIGGLFVVLAAFFPVIIIAVGRAWFLAFDTPLMLIARVIDDEVHDNPNAAFFGFRNQRVHVR